MKKILILFCTALLITSCGSEPQNKYLKYQNIIILSDMSDRMDNEISKDLEKINEIIQYFKKECVKPGEKIGDKSSISFSSFSEKTIAIIDIDKIKNLGEKQQFINSTGKFQNSGLDRKIEDFKEDVKNAYESTSNRGLDLISLLNDKIENEPIVKQNKYLTDGIDTTFVQYDNHIHIFTDGYLEYYNRSSNSQFYFGVSNIEKARKFCNDNDVDITKALEMDGSLGIPAIIGDKNKFINLHVLETQERDKDDKLQTYKYQIGQRDNEILKAVWKKWSEESGFKSFEWKKY